MKEPTDKIKKRKYKNICGFLILPVSMLLAFPAKAGAQTGAQTGQKELTELVVEPFVEWEVSGESDQREADDSPEEEKAEREEAEPASDGKLEVDHALSEKTEEESGAESESGTEIEMEAETESGTELTEAEELNIRLNYFLSTMPEDFVFPMVTEEAELVFGPGPGNRGQGYLEEYRGLDGLEPIVEEELSGYEGDWSVYVKNLSTGEEFVLNDRPMKSASVMKLFILGTVYRAFESGDLDRSEEVMTLVRNMITVSDNESSNQLLYRLGDSSYERGIEKVNEFIQAYGFSDMTTEFNGFENAATVMDGSHFNQVAAKDCGKLLEDIYRRNWVNRAASNEIEEMLLEQHTRYKIPSGLPEGVLCGNKSGEMDTTENDAAIIYSENCDYILVVLSSDWYSKDEAISRISSLSRTVYEYLN